MSIKTTLRVIMGKTALPRFLGCFDRIICILAGNKVIHECLDELDFFKITPLTTELAALEQS